VAIVRLLSGGASVAVYHARRGLIRQAVAQTSITTLPSLRPVST
jgi:hypothetical protein